MRRDVGGSRGQAAIAARGAEPTVLRGGLSQRYSCQAVVRSEVIKCTVGDRSKRAECTALCGS